MPWKVGDVDRHKKGLTPAQKKKWVSIANAVLRDCISGGGSTSSCEGKAIRIANSKFTEEGGDTGKMKKVPKLALTFSNPAEGSVQLAIKDGEPKLHMLAYSGGVIKGHWWWGDLAIDLEGMTFPEKKYPVLEDHDRSKKIAFINKPKITDNQLVVQNGTFVDTPPSQEFQKLSQQGFPYQASIHAEPTIIEKVGDDQKSKVNGFTFKGPGTIWRKCTFREVSVCVFGWDKNTKSQAFGDVELDYELHSTSIEEEENIGKEVKQIMTLEELREKDPEGYAKLMQEAGEMAKADLQTEFEQERKALTQQLTDVRSELTASNDKLKDLEKKEAIRAEKERQMFNERTAQSIWAEKLADSDLFEGVRRKIPEHVDPNGFLKEDGTLDAETFSAAVEKEIMFWTDEVGATTKVLGLGMSKKSVDQEVANKKKEEEEDDEWVKSMVKLTGEIQPQQTT